MMLFHFDFFSIIYLINPTMSVPHQMKWQAICMFQNSEYLAN